MLKTKILILKLSANTPSMLPKALFTSSKHSPPGDKQAKKLRFWGFFVFF
jgi:hypothetical protein